MGGSLEFSFTVEPVDADTGGAYRTVKADIVIDSSTPFHVQLHSVFYEVLSAYMGPNEERRSFFLDVADTLVEAYHKVTESSQG